MTCSRTILQTRSVTGGDFSCKRQLETPLRCKLQGKIASCDMALSEINLRKSQNRQTREVSILRPKNMNSWEKRIQPHGLRVNSQKPTLMSSLTRNKNKITFFHSQKKTSLLLFTSILYIVYINTSFSRISETILRNSPCCWFTFPRLFCWH